MNINVKIKVKAILPWVAALVLLTACTAATAASQTTFFNYQGQLQDDGHPANGNYDLAFELYDDATAGSKVGGTLTSAGLAVSGGLFSIGLNFGSTAFNGTQLWLQVYVNTIPLAPRTAIRLAPVAEYALTSASVSNGSITRAKLSGASLSANVGLTLHAGACGNGTFGVTNAQIGDAVVISWGAGYTPPTGIMFGASSVTAANTIKVQLCNVSNADWSDGTAPVTIQTFR